MAREAHTETEHAKTQTAHAATAQAATAQQTELKQLEGHHAGDQHPHGHHHGIGKPHTLRPVFTRPWGSQPQSVNLKPGRIPMTRPPIVMAGG